MTFQLTWRAEDLTFTSCRKRTAFEFEARFGTTGHKNRLRWPRIVSTNLPQAYVDSERGAADNGVVDFGVANAGAIVAGKTYTLKYRLVNHLGRNETLRANASRGYRLSPCPGPDSYCVNGWTHDEKFGPAQRIPIFDFTPVDENSTVSWTFPSRSTLVGQIIRDPSNGEAHLLDGTQVKHPIPDGGTYNCLTAAGVPVTNSFASIPMDWVLKSFASGSAGTCTTGQPPAGPPPPTSPPTTPPQPSGPSISLSQGAAAPSGFWYSASVSGLAPGAQLTLTCRDSVSPGGFYDQTYTADSSGGFSDATVCYSADHPDHWITAANAESNHVTW